MGRTEFLTETDCERALVGRAKAKASTRAKWRSSSSACRRVLEKCLTPPTLLEMGMLRQRRAGASFRVATRQGAKPLAGCVFARVAELLDGLCRTSGYTPQRGGRMTTLRSEERRVGKEWRSSGARCHEKK